MEGSFTTSISSETLRFVAVWALLVWSQSASSLPLTNSRNQAAASTSVALTTVIHVNGADFADDDEELARVLEMSARDLRQQPANFVSDDLSDEEVLRLFQTDTEGTATQASVEQAEQEVREVQGVHEAQEIQGAPARPDEMELEGAVQPVDQEELNVATEAPMGMPAETTTETITTTTTTLDPLLYVDTEEEYAELLGAIKEEFLETKRHPANYVRDDSELEFIISRLQEDENVIGARLGRWENNLPLIYDPEICPICRDDMEIGVDSRKLDCNHEFHSQCLGSYLDTISSYENIAACPICRKKFDLRRERHGRF